MGVTAAHAALVEPKAPQRSPAHAGTPAAPRAGRATHASAMPGNQAALRAMRDPSRAAVQRAAADRTVGQPLGAAMQSLLERSHGRSLADVRIHTDSRANELATGLHAEAFTRGQDIYFRTARYDPASARSQPILRHEIAHTIQQRAGSGPAPIGDATDEHEQAAGEAERATHAGPMAATEPRARPPAVQRFESKEHESLGNVTGVPDIDLGGGVHLSWGQIVALAGDYYGTVEELLDDTRTPPGRVRIRAALDQYGSPTVAATLTTPSTAADQDAAFNRLILLALRNVQHFLLGGDARATWLDYHFRAIDSAISAGLAHDRAALDQAYVLEAFGQHFLTDSFAAGHIRTPRRDIMDWYLGTFAPRVFDHLFTFVLDRGTDGAFDQVPWGYKAAAGLAGYLALKEAVRRGVKSEMDAMIAKAGGRAAVIEWIGLGLAGAVSGAIHDLENVRGLHVSSAANPAGWMSYGDANLDKIAPGATVPQNRVEAQNAVLAAKADIDDAFNIAWAENTLKSTAPLPTALPSAVFFGFDHFDLSTPAARQVHLAALHLIYNPAVELDLVGHTDRVGDDAYNDELSAHRAWAVADAITAEGVAPARLGIGSRGEREPVTADPRQFWRNRRVVFIWRTSSTPTASHDIPRERATATVRRRIGPPYRAEQFLPTPVVGADAPLPDWHWGSMPKTLQTDVATWVTGHLTGPIATALLSPVLGPKPHTVAGVTVMIEMRPIAEAASKELLGDPIKFLNDALGETAGP